MYLSTSTGVRTGCHYLYVCVTFVVFTDCESCTRPISTNPGPMEADEYGLTRGTCFVARRLEVVAIAGLLWISWCVLDGAIIFLIFFFSIYFLLRTHTACCKYEAASCLMYLSTSNEARPRERSDRGRLYRGAHRVPLFNLSVCVCV